MMPTFLDSLLDRSVLYSFDRTGFRRHARAFRADDLAVNLAGKNCLVTGANSGIGRVTARELARRRATVWLLCRNRDRGEEAQATISRETGNANVRLAVVDVADLGSVRSFVARFPADKIDVLIHNAGVVLTDRHETADGIELTLATNAVGPFLLTQLLLPKLSAAAPSRVIFVSSGGMYTQRLSLEDLDWHERKFDGVSAYAQTKRMHVVLNELFAAHVSTAGISFFAMHPGWADTAALRNSLPRFWRWMRHRLRSADEGADTVVWLASCPRLQDRSGLFWFDRAVAPSHLLPFTVERAEDRERLWDLCTKLTNA